MSEHEIKYRGVAVPKELLIPHLFGANILDAFKMGVDGATDLLTPKEPEPVSDGTNGDAYDLEGFETDPDGFGVWVVLDGTEDVYYRGRGTLKEAEAYTSRRELERDPDMRKLGRTTIPV